MAREKLNTFPPSANHVGFELNVRRNNMSWSIGTSYSIWYLLFLTGTYLPARAVVNPKPRKISMIWKL